MSCAGASSEAVPRLTMSLSLLPGSLRAMMRPSWSPACRAQVRPVRLFMPESISLSLLPGRLRAMLPGDPPRAQHVVRRCIQLGQMTPNSPVSAV